MSLFKLVKLALDALYAEAMVQYHTPSTLNSAVHQRLGSLNSSYHRLTEGNVDPIDYSDLAARIAYVYCYAGAHADHLRYALQSFRDRQDDQLFLGSRLRISSVGSGPGTDVFGVLKYLQENPKEPAAVHARLFDHQPDWKDARKALKRAYANHPDIADGDSLQLTTKTESLDVWKKKTVKRAKHACRGDLTTLCYVVSEVYSQNQGPASRRLTKLLRRIQPGAYVLYVDNDSSPLTQYFDGICREAGLTRLSGYSGHLDIAYSEEKSDLAPYLSRFDWSPKLGSNLCLRLLTKSA